MTEQSNPTRAAAVERLAEEFAQRDYQYPGPGGIVWDRSANDAFHNEYREMAARFLRDIGAVFVDPALVEAVREADKAHAAAESVAGGWACAAACEDTRLALAAHVMGQVDRG